MQSHRKADPGPELMLIQLHHLTQRQNRGIELSQSSLGHTQHKPGRSKVCVPGHNRLGMTNSLIWMISRKLKLSQIDQYPQIARPTIMQIAIHRQRIIKTVLGMCLKNLLNLQGRNALDQITA